MLSSIVASKAARLMAFCVCPVVGTGTVVMTVPKAKQAVHRATAPRQYALPKTRERLPETPLAISAPPCPLGESAGIMPAYLGDQPQTLFTSLPPGTGGPGGSLLPSGGGGGGGPSPVPEAGTWLQMIAGFLLLGGSLRIARRRPDDEDLALLDRADAISKGARP